MTSRIEDAQSVQAKMVHIRRQLHQHPEVGLELVDTHDYLLGSLRALGFEVEMHPSAGLTVRVPGFAPDGTTIVLRADMDALPVTESSDADFASVREGAMHACGHDLHMTMLLGAAEVMTRKPPRRDVVLAFQPGEETDRGALRTLGHRNLATLTGPANAFALHVHAVLPAHTVNYRSDTFMAFGDWFQVDFHGEGGHASRPESAGNPIEAASWFVQDVRSLAEQLSRDEHVVATVTECRMGNTVNVIPADGRLRGTIRTLSADRRDRLVDGMRTIAVRSGERARVTASFQLHEGYPAVVSDRSYVSGMVAGLAGTELAPRVQEMAAPSMVIEDFAYFLHRWPGTMVYLGAQVPGHSAFNHSSEVVFDEDVLATGAALLLLAADGWSL
ncbi:MAG: M20 family metallopeptidase [Nocardioidaceae bacterium]